jgi:hypothetical protein
MTSRISSLTGIYGKFTEILPEELLDDSVRGVLENAKLELQNIIQEDHKFIRNLIPKRGIGISLDDFEQSSYVIRKAFLLRNERVERTPELIKFLLAHWRMCKEPLLFLSNNMLEILPIVKKCFEDYNKLPIQQRAKRIAFINLTRRYQEFIGSAVNILDIIGEYSDMFNLSCNKIDPSYKLQGISRSAHIYEDELLAGATELLLRGNFGRHTASPLIRSVLEVILTRNILQTDQSKKFKKKIITILPGFQISDILNAADKVGVQVSIGTDSLRRIYEWGSISVHRAWRMQHVEMWYAWFAVNNIRRGIFVLNNNQRIESVVDSLLHYLEDKGKIKIESRK